MPKTPETVAEATVEIERLAGARRHVGEGSDGEPLDGVSLFDTKPNAGLDLVTGHQARLLPAGAFLFLYDHGFGAGPDVIGIVPTTDKFELIRRVRTDGANYGHDTSEVIAWLRDLDRDEPFDLLGAGNDFIEGTFRGPVKDRARLAERIHAFCPDFVNQGIGLDELGEPHALIENFFATNREFYFWWD